MVATATQAPVKVADVIDAMRSIQTEGDRWNLAEELAVLIPKGNGEGKVTFGTIIDQATAEGVAGKLSVNTLRLYRDTATRWPASKRVKNVSFSAHREAMVLPNIEAAAKMLGDLAKNGGPDKVTVATVRKAVAVKQGKVIKPKAGSSNGTSKIADVLADIKGGGAQLIASITPATSSSDLDKFYAGLQKVTAHVERLRAKAARAKKPAAATPTPKKAVGAKKGAKGGAGDVRGL